MQPDRHVPAAFAGGIGDRAARRRRIGSQEERESPRAPWYATAIIGVAIALIISSLIDSAVAGLLGVAVLIRAEVMTDVDVFGIVDSNVMAVLVSVWVIAGDFGRTGISSGLSVKALQLSGGKPGWL